MSDMGWKIPDNPFDPSAWKINQSAWEDIGIVGGTFSIAAENDDGDLWVMPHARMDVIKTDNTFEVTFTALPDADTWTGPPEPAKPTWRERLVSVWDEAWDRIYSARHVLRYGYDDDRY